ncbi:MAG: hypothetical protein JXR56_01670 [Candidatus Cloacimonetes bacterium]|nr:hypothetical protein [Candidatus Cloacimonadota bacterium]
MKRGNMEANNKTETFWKRKSKIKFSMRTILISTLLIQILAVTTVISYLFLISSSKSIKSLVNDSIEERDNRIQEQISNYFNPPVEIAGIVSSLFTDKIIDHKNQGKLINQFKSLVKNRESINSVYFGNPNGGLANAGRDKKHNSLYVIYTEDFKKGALNKYALNEQGEQEELIVSVPEFDARTRPWYKQAVEGDDIVWSQVYSIATGDDLGITASKAVRDGKELLGVIGVDLFLSDISVFLSSLSTVGSTFIIDDSGQLIASSEQNELFRLDDTNNTMTRVNARESESEVIRNISTHIRNEYHDFANVKKESIFPIKHNWEKYLIHVTPFKVTDTHNWLIVICVPEDYFMTQVKANRKAAQAYIFYALLLSFLVAILLAKVISQPITNLNARIKNFSLSNKIGDPESSFIKEIDELAQESYKMKKTIQSVIDSLKQEVAHRKQTEEELFVAKEKAEESNRLKTSFLANMSHELRTPLSGILGFSEILYSQCNDPDHQEMVGIINQSGNRLLTTLNLILDLSRIEANKHDIILSTFELNEVLNQIVELFKPLATKKGIELLLESDPAIMNINSDRIMIEHIVNELVNNAIKYSEKGCISIITKKDNEFVLIEVRDNGIGIQKNRLEIIFEAFRQGSEGFGRTFDGSGLGLTICRKYARLLGGDITVQSEYGDGSTFTVRLPLEPVDVQK